MSDKPKVTDASGMKLVCDNCGDQAIARVAHHESGELVFEHLCEGCYERGDEILWRVNDE